MTQERWFELQKNLSPGNFYAKYRMSYLQVESSFQSLHQKTSLKSMINLKDYLLFLLLISARHRTYTNIGTDVGLSDKAVWTKIMNVSTVITEAFSAESYNNLKQSHLKKFADLHAKFLGLRLSITSVATGETKIIGLSFNMDGSLKTVVTEKLSGGMRASGSKSSTGMGRSQMVGRKLSLRIIGNLIFTKCYLRYFRSLVFTF